MSFRQIVTEKDLSGYVAGNNNEIGAFVIKSRKGATFPVLIRNYDDFITWFGEPNQDFWGGYEVLNYITTAPAWVVRSIGSDYTHSGVDVRFNSVTSFGTDTGRIINNYNISALPVQYSHPVIKQLTNGVYSSSAVKKIADGTSVVYEGFIYDSSFLGSINATYDPSINGRLRLKVYSNSGIFKREITNVSVSGTTATRQIDGVGLIEAESTIFVGLANENTGKLKLTFDYTEGSVFEYISSVTYTNSADKVSDKGLDISKTYAIYLNIDGVVIDNGNLELKSMTDIEDVNTISSINNNTTIQQVINYINYRISINPSLLGIINLVSLVSNKIKIKGTVGDDLKYKFRLKSAVDTVIYPYDAIPILFQDESTYSYQLRLYGGLKETTPATSPSGGILNGEYIVADFIVEQDGSSDISHSFFATSPYEDKQFDYRVAIKYTPDTTLENGNRIYTLNLYQYSSNVPTLLAQYEYSLDKIKNNQGKTIYIEDVFRNNPYLIPVINENYTGEISRINQNVIDILPVNSVKLTGGKQGSSPNDTDNLKAWAYFKKAKRYPIKLFIDIYGNSVGAIKDLIMNYQKYAYGITIVPFNYTPEDAIDYRQSLALDFDKISLYHNWEQISDVLNGGSLIWVSGMGKVGTAYANMINIFDAESPAGVNENGIGGQLINGYQAVAVQYDYDDYYLKTLDDTQINPKILDPLYGLILKGDRTLRVTKGDTAFIGARRLYNYILSNIVDQVLTLQEFRLNDSFHRTRMAELCGQIIQPILNAGYLREAQIICDDTNNTDEVLNRREFVVDIYVKVTPNSQVIKLNFVRLSQTQSIANIL